VALGFVLAAAFAAPSLGALKQSQRAWKHASDVADRVIEQTMAAHPHPAEGATFFFLNVPDSVDGAFVIRFDNMRPALRLHYGDESIDAVRIVTLDEAPLGTSLTREGAYFSIGAMGGNVHVPREVAERPEQPGQWRELSQLGILGKSFRYSDNWEQYSSSPFLAYSRGEMKPLSSDELREVVDNLYSLR
jgi:hypothetical protein